jgi:hypothetical protein
VKVLLVANNPNAVVPSLGYDLYVHFNSAIHWGKTPINQSIIAVRKNAENKKHGSFHYTTDGMRKPYYLDVPTYKLVAVGWADDVRTVDKNIPIIALECVPFYQKGKSPTSGFAAIHHYLALGEEVTLCGFDLPKASYYETTKLHLLDYETGKINEMVEGGIIDRH